MHQFLLVIFISGLVTLPFAFIIIVLFVAIVRKLVQALWFFISPVIGAAVVLLWQLLWCQSSLRYLISEQMFFLISSLVNFKYLFITCLVSSTLGIGVFVVFVALLEFLPHDLQAFPSQRTTHSKRERVEFHFSSLQQQSLSMRLMQIVNAQ